MAESDSPRGRSAWNDGPWNEIAGLILFGIGLVILLALVSYSSDDPSWNSVGADVRIRNWIGPVGAKIADTLFQAFGLGALFVPVTLFLAGWWQWQDERPEVPKPKALGIFLMIVAFTGVLTMIGSEHPKAFYLGGFVGQWLVYGPVIGLQPLLGTIGAIVALLILFIIGLLIGTEFSIVATVMRSQYQDQQPGMMTTIGDRYRAWRDERDSIRGRKETADQLRAKLRQRNRPPAASGGGVRREQSGGGAKALLPVDNSSELQGEIINRHPDEETNAYSEMFHGSPAPAVPLPEERIKRSRPSSRVPTGAAPGASTAPLDAPLLPSPSSTTSARSTKSPPNPLSPSSPPPPSTPSTPPPLPPPPPPPPRSSLPPLPLTAGRKKAAPPITDLDEAYGDGDSPGDDFNEIGASAQRSVDDMMSTASVKRPDHSEEGGRLGAVAKVGKMVTAIARIAADYKLPSTEMLTPPAQRSEMEEAELLERARQLAEKCAEFNVSGQVKQISPGPVVTTFEFKPDPGVKYSRVTSLVDDLCLALKAESIRIDRIPGKSTVGIEVPNTHREIIRLREVIESKRFRESESKLTLALGKTIDGSNYAADLAKMPHLLIAGATGAGKSVMLNGMLISLLHKATPDEVKMILVDPKRLELGLYADIPHLLTPIVTDPKRASFALKWAVSEMENRYKHLAAFGVRNIDQYNTEACSGGARKTHGDQLEEPTPLPYIVVVIDELADLMMVSARDVEESITRLAQMARAVGIHLVLATQRPSVDVITGLIKANFPSRISFRVSSKVDSRTIIDTNGAEQLLGQGDMLFLPPGTSRLVRVHGAYVDEKEVKRICDFIRSQGKPAYDEKVVMSDKEVDGAEIGEMAKDEKYDEAVRIVIQSGKASTSLLQRHLRIGYGRAASIIDTMHREGIVGPEDGSKPRQVLVKPDFLERLDQMREE